MRSAIRVMGWLVVTAAVFSTFFPAIWKPICVAIQLAGCFLMILIPGIS